MGDTGKIWNERKFRHLIETDKIFEFKAEADRILRFFFVGKRLILTHGPLKGVGSLSSLLERLPIPSFAPSGDRSISGLSLPTTH